MKNTTLSGWVENIIKYRNHFFFDLRGTDAVTRVICKQKWVLAPSDYVVMCGNYEPQSSTFNAETLQYHSAAIDRPPFSLKDEVASAIKTNERVFWLREKSRRDLFMNYSRLIVATQFYFSQKGYCRIVTPKLMSEASESGAQLFRLVDTQTYEGLTLAQSPQLYKQMAINAGFNKVYELGPIFRAEKFKTRRHSPEAYCLDVEGNFSTLQQLIEVIRDYISYVYVTLGLSYPKVGQCSYEDMVERYTQLLHGEKLTPEQERAICKDMDCDYVIITHFPAAHRPFYTKEDFSFDLVHKDVGEIASGSIRETQYSTLIEKEAPITEGAYLRSFKYGAPQSGGFGLGLERLMMALYNLSHIKDIKLF